MKALYLREALLSLVAAVAMSPPLSAQQDEEIIQIGRRIVGGESTDIKEHPWQVALNIKRPDGTYLCGGSIIAQKWVLSAAHCFYPAHASDLIKAKAGATNYRDEGTWVQTEKVVIDEDYNPITHENDLALIKLKIVPTGHVIPLVDADAPISVGEPLEVTGWGVTESGQSSTDLRKAIVPYVDNATCNEPASYNGAIRPGMICAGHKDGGTDSCQGDSGGPLVQKTVNGPVLVGVVSWGEGCARKLKYGVYTRVADYRRWINDVIAANRN